MTILKEVSCVKFRGNTFVDTKHEVAEEAPLEISVNGSHFVTAMLSPEMKREFVIGHLLTEGIIKDLSELESVQIEGHRASALVAHFLPGFSGKKIIVSGCGGGTSFLDDSKLPAITSCLVVEQDTVFTVLKATLTSPVHRITGGVHLVGLFVVEGHEAKPICIVADIGRHNAFDKVIGYGLLHDVPFDHAFVACSGRISSEMALKCARTNISLIASHGATTSLAITLAEKTGLCIIGFVRGETMNVYTHTERVRRVERGL
ncbi:MAG: formate dehydrogenase accessory sulfurtransferase FdhD [Methanomicrobia archaeon]|nr:formate dehydrogenase accessory sulfurtransferase FdhD [Methanomicrobia archaeon]